MARCSAQKALCERSCLKFQRNDYILPSATINRGQRSRVRLCLIGMATLDFGVTIGYLKWMTLDFDHLVNIAKSKCAFNVRFRCCCYCRRAIQADFTFLASRITIPLISNEMHSLIAYNTHRASLASSWYVPGVFVNAEYHSNG